MKREGWDGDWVISLCLCSLIPYDLLCSILPEFYSFLISTQSSKLGGGGGGIFTDLIYSFFENLFIKSVHC